MCCYVVAWVFGPVSRQLLGSVFFFFFFTTVFGWLLRHCQFGSRVLLHDGQSFAKVLLGGSGQLLQSNQAVTMMFWSIGMQLLGSSGWLQDFIGVFFINFFGQLLRHCSICARVFWENDKMLKCVCQCVAKMLQLVARWLIKRSVLFCWCLLVVVDWMLWLILLCGQAERLCTIRPATYINIRSNLISC